MFKIALQALVTAAKGLAVTLAHLFGARRSRKVLDVRKDNYFEQQEGVTTVQFPREKMPIPEVGRNQLQVNINDRIICN